MTTKKLLTISIAVISLSLFSATSVLAQSASPSAQALRDSVKEKVAMELAAIKQAVSKKAFLGSINSKSEAQITITNYHNQTRTALVSTDTTIKLKNGKDGTLKDLSSGQYVLVMGDVDSQNTMTTSRLLVIDQPVEDRRSSTVGIITTITTSTITVETASKASITAKITSGTGVSATVDGKAEKVKAATLKAGDKVVIIYRTSGSTTSALNIHKI